MLDHGFVLAWMVTNIILLTTGAIHKQVEMKCDQFQLLKQFYKKIKLWTCAHPSHFGFLSPIL
jgi:hypothetical protein